MPRSTSHISSSLVAQTVVALAILLSASLSTFAQDTVTGAFEGTVTDSQTGNPLKDAAVEIINQQTNVTISLKTDYRGRFFQGLLLPGTYIVRVSMNGYLTKAAIQLLKITYTGEVVPVPVALDPAPAGTTPPPPATVAPVPAETNDIRASIITTDGRRMGSYSSTEVVSLPVGAITTTRTFDELALLLPGVAPPPQTLGSVAGPGVGAGVGSAGQFSVNGLRSRANNFTVDGSDNNDEDIGVRRQGFVALIPQPLESIQEYQVITLLAPAQFGRNIGGQVNAVSKSGGSKVHGTVWGRFNSSQLNARNFFDTANGSATSTVLANNQAVLIQTRNAAGAVTSQQPLSVQNESGGEDSFTYGQAGFVMGGPVTKKLFYFASLEETVVNAAKEESFAVPTLSQRGAFGSGLTGLFQDPFTGAAITSIPTAINGGAILSLYPFPNNPSGVYGANTLTRSLPASGAATILSGKLDQYFNLNGLQQTATGRYNFSNDWREIPVTGGALFSTLRPKIQTQNFSFFLNGQVRDTSTSKLFNQFRFSFGRTRLNFEEVRDLKYQIPSVMFPGSPFLLNAPELLNITLPTTAGIPNSGQVIYLRQSITVEQELTGPIGHLQIAGFSPIGVDTFNFPQRRVNNTFQISNQTSIWRGKHNYLFGLDLRRTDLNSELPRNSRPDLTFGGSPRLIFDVAGVPRLPTPNDPNPIINPIDLASIGAPNNLFLTLNSGGPDEIGLRYYQLNFFGQDEWRVRKNLSLSLGLRYEYNTPPREIDRLIENTFTSPLIALVPGLDSFVQGRTRITDPDLNNFAPRLGIAYSSTPFGQNRLTVIRAGYGIFYDQNLGAVVSQSRNVFPSFFTLNFGGGPFTSISNEFPLQIFNPANTAFGNQLIPIVQPGSLNRINPQFNISTLLPSLLTFFPSAISPTIPSRTLKMPIAHHYSVTLEQQLGKKSVFSVAYVGTTGHNLLRFTTPNLGPSLNIVPTRLDVLPLQFQLPEFRGRVSTPPRALNGLGAIQLFQTSARSRYDSLQIQFRQRLTDTLRFQSSYWISNSSDDVSDVFELAGASALPQNSLTFNGELGPASFDIRHSFTFEFDYEIPSTRGFAGQLLRNTQLSGTGRLYSGQPFTVNSVIDINQDGNLTDRLNSLAGLVETGTGEQPLLLTTNNTLSLLAPFGQDGQINRNSFRAGGLVDIDLSVLRTFSLSPSTKVLVRCELLNVFNRTNFGIPVRYLEAAGFGKATSTVTPGRRLLISAKFQF